MTLPSHITLIGFSGSGKSQTAQHLATILGWQTADTDDLIEAAAGIRVPDILAAEGELSLRRRETEQLRLLQERQQVVVSAGGGAPVWPDSRRSMVAAGIVVYLDASFEETERRLATEDGGRARPLRSPRIFDQRAAVYRTVADLTVSSDALTPQEMAAEIARWHQTFGERAYNRPGRLDQLTRTPEIMPAVLDNPRAATTVRTASSDYPVYVSWGALDDLGTYVTAATRARRAFVISDSAVLSRWGETAVANLRGAGIETATYTLAPGDSSKSIDDAARAYDWLASQRAERRDTVVALGGGMVGDFSGFVAGTYLRGMPVVQVPTSLLAMVDASIGGKTAVNHAGAKNIVGLFYQPRAVVQDVATLATLPKRALIEGMGEVIKHAFIRDEALLELLEDRLDDLLALRDRDLVASVIARNVQIKGDVVSQDERETGGVRELLNYGHTLGHAFESAGGYDALLHGEAVSVGMMAAAMIGQGVGLTSPEIVQRQRRILERAGLPLKPPSGLDRQRIWNALALDKKVVAGGQRWVLLRNIGDPIVRNDIPTDMVESVLDDLLS